MASICFYFQVHQPFRIKKYRVFDIGSDHDYFNDGSESNLNNRKIMEKVVNKSYLPANRLMLDLLEKYPNFKISYSFSGIFLDQIEHDFPEVLRSFQKLVKTGRVEILSETYYHSLAFIYSRREFKKQVEKHKKKIQRLFGVTPGIFRNTELIFNNELAKEIEKMGYRGLLAEGADHILEWRSPNFLYTAPGAGKIKLLLKNYRLSDDIAFRFSESSWEQFPLYADKYAEWLSAINGNGEIINLFMDYETFGEHQWEESGIFKFLEALPAQISKYPDNDFVTPSEAVARYKAVAEIDFPHYVSWADAERDLSAWRSNSLQYDALEKIYSLEKAALSTKDKNIIEDWRRLQASDHFYYMCTKWFADGDVHKYFNPYESPYEAFIAYMNVLNDLRQRIAAINNKEEKKEKIIEQMTNYTIVKPLHDYIINLKNN
jgi:alpha-amylase